MSITAVNQYNEVIFPEQYTEEFKPTCITCNCDVIPVNGYYKLLSDPIDKYSYTIYPNTILKYKWVESYWQHSKFEGINCPDRKIRGSFFHRAFKSIFIRDLTEYYRSDINKRADILLKNCHCTLEIQSSRMSSKTILNRIESWNRVGFDIIWLFRNNILDDKQELSIKSAYFNTRNLKHVLHAYIPIYYFEEHNGEIYQLIIYDNKIGYKKIDEKQFFNMYIKPNMEISILKNPIQRYVNEWKNLDEYRKAVVFIFYKMYGPKGVDEFIKTGHVDYEKYMDNTNYSRMTMPISSEMADKEISQEG